MATYAVPELETPTPIAAKEVLLVASGDLRQSANQVCWPAQQKMEEKLIGAFRAEGYALRRAHPYDERLKHGFIHSQRMGMDIFEHIHPDAPLVVAEAVWQYSYHILPGLLGHRGPILTVANWSGEWPGLVGMLNLNGCLHKAGREVLHALEQRLRGRSLSGRAARMASRAPYHDRRQPRAGPRP